MFARLDPQAFGTCVAGWMAGVCEATGPRHIAVDGKAVRSAPGNTFGGCLHLVSAWAAESRLILGQAAVADGSHEIAAVPGVPRVLELEGVLAALDAAGCQKEIARQVRAGGGHYLLAAKGNQPTLHDAVRAVFDRACGADFAGVGPDGHAAVEDGHGRHEERYTTVIYDPPGLPPDWPGVAAVVRVGRRAARTPAPPTTTSPARGGRRPSSGARSASTGRSRTSCTGAWTYRSGRTPTRRPARPGRTGAGVRLFENRRERLMVVKFEKKPGNDVLDRMKDAGFR